MLKAPLQRANIHAGVGEEGQKAGSCMYLALEYCKRPLASA